MIFKQIAMVAFFSKYGKKFSGHVFIDSNMSSDSMSKFSTTDSSARTGRCHLKKIEPSTVSTSCGSS